MRTFILCIALTGFTAIVPHGISHAQIQTKTFTYNKAKKSDDNKPKLFVTNDDENEASNENADPEAQEIDRIFEQYKALSEKQELAATEKPLKAKKKISKKEEPAPAKQEKTGFASILDQYEKNKANRSKTNSIRFKTPDNVNN